MASVEASVRSDGPRRLGVSLARDLGLPATSAIRLRAARNEPSIHEAVERPCCYRVQQPVRAAVDTGSVADFRRPKAPASRLLGLGRHPAPPPPSRPSRSALLPSCPCPTSVFAVLRGVPTPDRSSFVNYLGPSVRPHVSPVAPFANYCAKASRLEILAHRERGCSTAPAASTGPSSNRLDPLTYLA